MSPRACRPPHPFASSRRDRRRGPPWDHGRQRIDSVLRRLRYVFLLLPLVALAQGPGTLLPLPPPPVPAGNPITPAKANLGKILFWDEQLSSSRAVACGTCHRPEAAGTDPRSVVNDPTCANPGPDKDRK